MPNGAELFVRSSIQLGLDTIFTLVGDHLNEVLAAAARAGMRIVDLRHESSVAHAADAWARIHRRPALSLVTGGPAPAVLRAAVETAPSPRVGEVIELLRQAERPAVVAGSGVWWSHAEDALRRFIEHTSLPLYTITMARGAVPDDRPLVMGYAD